MLKKVALLEEKQPNTTLKYTSENHIAQAVVTLQAGGLVAFPTETVYGLAASPFTNSKTYKVWPPVSESLPNSRLCERIKPCKCK